MKDNTERQLAASESMLRRIQLLTRFVNTYYRDEFTVYWEANYPGKAEPQEFLDFFSREGIEQVLILNRAIRIGELPCMTTATLKSRPYMKVIYLQQ